HISIRLRNGNQDLAGIIRASVVHEDDLVRDIKRSKYGDEAPIHLRNRRGIPITSDDRADFGMSRVHFTPPHVPFLRNGAWRGGFLPQSTERRCPLVDEDSPRCPLPRKATVQRRSEADGMGDRPWQLLLQPTNLGHLSHSGSLP